MTQQQLTALATVIRSIMAQRPNIQIQMIQMFSKSYSRTCARMYA